MTPQKKLEEAVERMDIWVGKHPTGALTLTARGSRLIVLPEENGWRLTEPRTYGGSRVVGAYPYEDVDKLVHRLLKWSWDYAYKN